MVVVLRNKQTNRSIKTTDRGPNQKVHLNFRRENKNNTFQTTASTSNISHINKSNSRRRSSISEPKSFKSFATIADQYVITNDHNLYNPTPTLDDLKTKYKHYMGWLSENATQLRDFDHQGFVKRLNWYNYEQSVNSNADTNCLKFLKKLPKDKNSPASGLDSYRQKLVDNNLKDLLKTSKQYHSSLSLNKASPASSGAKTDLEGALCDDSRSSISQNGSSSDLSKMLRQQQQQQQAPQIKPKGVMLTSIHKVKFEPPRIYPSVNRKLPPVGLTLSKSITTRPILKTQNDYFSSPSSEISDASMASQGSSTNLESIKSTGSLRLPPIVACSDDFYAVLRELEDENQSLTR